MAENHEQDRVEIEGADELLRSARASIRSGNYLAALRNYDRLIGIGQADATVWLEVGNALVDVGEYAQASGAYQECLQLDGRNAEAHNNLARALYRLGDIETAVDHLRIATGLGESLHPWLNLATILPGDPRAVHSEILDVRRAFAGKLAAEQPARRMRRRPARDGRRQTGRRDRKRIRVGYLSSFFHAANYMKPVWGLINRHDRDRFELHLLSDSPIEKGTPGYHAQRTDQIHVTGALDNDQLADKIADLSLDILVDLNSYSTPERLGLYVEPLPTIAIAWFNAYATTGLPGIPYLVGDDEVIDPGEECWFSESMIRLPLSYLTFEVTHPAPPVSPAPIVGRGSLTFGSLVAQYKITRVVLDAWSAILRRVPDARLLLANAALKSPQNRQYVLAKFAERGVPQNQLVLQGPAEHYRYLQYYDQIDVALDAFPYNGGTTTMEAMWQGVPVLTFDGDRWASRTSQTLIRRTPLSEFVASGVEQYVEQAVGLATSTTTAEKLSTLRPRMRELLTQSAACDTRRLAAGMEAIYQQLLQ